MDFFEFRKNEFARRDARLKVAQPMQLVKTTAEKKKLHVVYAMTWTGICGGSKIILQHCNELVKAGQDVTIVCHFARPSWFALEQQVNFIQVPFDKVLCESIPACDVIVATYWKEIYECVEQSIAPVVYFEQGDTHLFDPSKMDMRTMSHIVKQINLAPFIYTVSTFAKEKLKENFGVDAEVIPNAIDKGIFYKGENEVNDNIVITAIGSENVAFKCIENIVVAVALLKKIGYDVEFKWVSPDTPAKLKTVPVVVNPVQAEIGHILRSSDIFVCASLYESFCLPILEAFACGTSVITTDNGGSRDFVIDGKNALIIKKNNIADVVDKLEILINKPDLRQNLSVEALKTTEKFDWALTTSKLLDYYFEIAKYKVLL